MNSTDQTKAIQKAVGTLEDGKIGASTINNFYKFMGNLGSIQIQYPYETNEFGCYVITGNPKETKLINGEGKKSVSNYDYSMSCTFTHPSGVTPISIMISDGKVIQPNSCRYWAGFPETVLYYTTDGKFGKKLVTHANQLPDNILWGVGGGDLKHFRLDIEGFKKFYHQGKWYDHSDVTRYTSHHGVGYDKYGNVLLISHKSCTLASFQARCKSLGMVDGIFTDGGSVCAYNAGIYKHKTTQRQGSIIKA